MFCPKCGNQIADGAKFCPKCGNAIAAAPVAATPVQPAPQTASAASPVASAPAHSAFDITRIVPAIPAVLAMVFACMPWIIVDQSVVSASNFVYLAIIVLLLWKVFTNSAEISRLKAKINELAQEMALAHLQADDDSDNASDTRNR